MEGLEEKSLFSNEVRNLDDENQKKERNLGLGFKNPNPNLDDQTIDHQLINDRDNELNEKLDKMSIEGSCVKERSDKHGLMDEKLVEKNGEGDFEGFSNGGFVKKTGDGTGCGVEGVDFDTQGKAKVEDEGIDTKSEAKVGDKEIDTNGAAKVKAEETVTNGVAIVEEKIDADGEGNVEKNGVEERDEGDYKEVKDGGVDKEGSKWSEIEDQEEYGNSEVVEGTKEAVGNYENGWDDDWGHGDNCGEIIGANEEQQYFENYEYASNGKGQYDGEAQWYPNVDADSMGFYDQISGNYQHPLRPDAEDCSFYMRTGNCKFGLNCKFNHPLNRNNQAARDAFKQREEFSDRSGQIECKYYLTADGCKYGKACRYNHGRARPAVAPVVDFNFLGLPIRVGEKECPYYMKNGSCKYGSNCRFNHPNPTAVGGGDSASQGSIKDTASGWSSARTYNDSAPFVPAIYPPNPTAPPNTDWNGHQAPVYRTSERKLPRPPAFAMSGPPSDANFYAHSQQQMIVEEFPERPGQPECSFYLKTGDCKYRSSCKFHHPKNHKPSFTLSDRGLPIRPDQNICTHYSRYGICKFGPSCKYDHSITNGNSVSSVGSDQGQPPRYGKLGDADGNWRNTEPLQQSV